MKTRKITVFAIASILGAIATYNEALTGYDGEKLEAIISDAAEYNSRLNSVPMAFFDPSLVDGYEESLDITGTGIMGYIDIDKIGVELPIYHGVSKEILQVGVGHLPGSSLPVGGGSTHCVLSGHRGLPSAKLFTDLDELEIGDEFTITVLDRSLTYKVDLISTVLPDETDDLQVVKGMDYCTLMTCTPYGINTHRLLVRGVRTEDHEERPAVFVKNEAFIIDPLIVAPVIAIPILIIALVLLFISDRADGSNDMRKESNAVPDEDNYAGTESEHTAGEEKAPENNDNEHDPANGKQGDENDGKE